MQATSISWTDYSSNPITYTNPDGQTVWACVKVSPGCAHCYAEATAHRWARGGPFTVNVMERMTPHLHQGEINAILRSAKISGKKVFIGDMTDVFGEWVPDAMLDQIFAAMALRPDVTFQVLTKRPERMRAYLTRADAAYDIDCATERVCGERGWCSPTPLPWPLPNVWLGVSVENQAAADARIPQLRATPAAVRFLSCEPLLEPVGLMSLFIAHDGATRGLDGTDAVDWVICGGESGPHLTDRFHDRWMDPAWAVSLRAQCDIAGVAFWFKQHSGRKPGTDPYLVDASGTAWEYHQWPGELTAPRRVS